MKFENEYPIWERGVPGSHPANWPWQDYKEEWSHEDDRNEDLVKWVTEPTIRVFLPDASKNTGAAVIICPGGGYNILAIDREGYRIASKLQKEGVAGIVLKYRHYTMFAARDDGQRALRFVRSKAQEWRLNPQAIGIGGCSAGGHLALHCASNLSPKTDWTPDEIDRVDHRPSFLMLTYPGTELPNGVTVGANIPPSFINVAADDAFALAPACLELFKQLQELKIPSELHVYQEGGHGYDLGLPAHNSSSWIGLFVGWLRANNFIKNNP